MKHAFLLLVEENFPGSEIERRIMFKTMSLQNSYALSYAARTGWAACGFAAPASQGCALLAVRNHQLADDSSVLRDKCAHFWEEIVLNAYHLGCIAEQRTKCATRPGRITKQYAKRMTGLGRTAELRTKCAIRPRDMAA